MEKLLFIITTFLFLNTNAQKTPWEIIYFPKTNKSSVSFAGGYLREHPVITSNSLDTLIQGDSITVLSYSGHFGYYNVIYKGKIGYASATSILNKMKSACSCLYLGMSKDEVIELEGYPNEKKKQTGEWGVHEQWIYDKKYIYIENGILSSWEE